MPLVNLTTGALVEPGFCGAAGEIQGTSVFAGLPQAALQALLAQAQAAVGQVALGGKVITAAYSQNDGSKSVTYNITSATQLRGMIYELQMLLGIKAVSRRPMRPFFIR